MGDEPVPPHRDLIRPFVPRLTAAAAAADLYGGHAGADGGADPLVEPVPRAHGAHKPLLGLVRLLLLLLLLLRGAPHVEVCGGREGLPAVIAHGDLVGLVLRHHRRGRPYGRYRLGGQIVEVQHGRLRRLGAWVPVNPVINVINTIYTVYTVYVIYGVIVIHGECVPCPQHVELKGTDPGR